MKVFDNKNTLTKKQDANAVMFFCTTSSAIDWTCGMVLTVRAASLGLSHVEGGIFFEAIMSLSCSFTLHGNRIRGNQGMETVMESLIHKHTCKQHINI